MKLYCERCQNVLGERMTDNQGKDYHVISIKVRGCRRRRYVVESIRSVECDRCGHIGNPFPVLASLEKSHA